MAMWKDLPPVSKIGPLECLDFHQPGKPVIVFFHGYGADAFDLAPMAGELGLRAQARWIFPQGPKTVDIGGGFSGRAWFGIDMAAHQRAAMTGEPVSYSDIRPPGATEARDKAMAFLKALGIPPGQLILGGFSQGSMLAVDLAFHLPENPLALVILSGTLADKKSLVQLAPRRKGLPFFQSHGEHDPILPFIGAEALKQELENAGWDSHWSGFPGGHEIPPRVLRDLTSFLKARLARALQ